MSEIDFAEIEKAMAELVNKAQGKERRQGLSEVADKRAQIAKKVETAHEQGDIATKRIIVASNKIRSSPRPNPTPIHHPQASSPQNPRVIDFVVPASQAAPANNLASTDEADANDDSQLKKTVGELSNEYLVGQVNDSEPNQDDGPLIKQDIEEQLDTDDYQGSADQDDYLEEPEITDKQSAEPKKPETVLEDLTGPSPAMSTLQEPAIAKDSLTSIQTHDDSIPDSDRISEEVGRVHKIYGQKLPKEYLKKEKRNQTKPTNTHTTIKRPKQKRGFAFYFVVIMVLASILVWSAAAYLYFAA